MQAIRYVGIRPRVKQTAKGEARPTQVAIIGSGDFKLSLDLESEQDELDFVLGRFPTGYRRVVEGEDLSKFLDHHIERDKEKKPTKVPTAYEGLKQGDVVSMALGGSGDYLAFALSIQGDKIGAKVQRITPFNLKSLRGESKKDEDAKFLAELVRDKPGLFIPVHVRDRKIVRVRECQRLRIDTMKARIGCEQRLRQAFIGKIFCSAEGLFPQGSIEKEFAAKKAKDEILISLNKEENRANRELDKAVQDTHVWQEVLSAVEGLGPAIGARLISVIQDIRRFENEHKLKKYLGAHVQSDGRFPRRRAGELADWSNEGRQALYLLMDQWNRRPESEWGKRFRMHKVRLRADRPEPLKVNKSFTILYRQMERFLRKAKASPVAALYNLSTVDGLYEYYRAGLSRLVELETADYHKGDLDIFDEQIKKLGDIGAATALLYTPAHIHSMAGWYTVNEFVVWLFVQWWRIEGRTVKLTHPPKEEEGETEAA